MYKNILIYSFVSIFMAGCFGIKIMQPPPSNFEFFKTNDKTYEDIKKTMIVCGYPNVNRGNRDDTNNDIAKREICMFRNGFKFNDGYKGMCSLQQQSNLPACQEKFP